MVGLDCGRDPPPEKDDLVVGRHNFPQVPGYADTAEGPPGRPWNVPAPTNFCPKKLDLPGYPKRSIMSPNNFLPFEKAHYLIDIGAEVLILSTSHCFLQKATPHQSILKAYLSAPKT